MKIGRNVADLAKKLPIVRKYAESLQLKLRDARRESHIQQLKKVECKTMQALLAEIKNHISVMIDKPRFYVKVDRRTSGTGLDRTMLSLTSQIYKNFEIEFIDGEEKGNRDHPNVSRWRLGKSKGQPSSLDFMVYLPSGMILHEFTFYEFANCINQYPSADLIYSDEDCLSEAGDHSHPFYKPDWSPDYLEAFNYIGAPACFRMPIVEECADSNSYFDFVLRFTEKTKGIHHVRKILGHRLNSLVRENEDRREKEDIEAISKRLQRTGRTGKVSEHTLHRGCYDIFLEMSEKPLVSVVIPTAGKTVRVGDRSIDLITNVVANIREKSTYKNVEIIVVDNDNLRQDQIELLQKHNCKLMSYLKPVFNVAAKLNLGAKRAKGQLLLLLNDDIEVIDPSWIERLVEQFEKPHIGAAGAKLLYPDGRIQHAGVVTNYGNPDHVRRYASGDDAGYFYSTCAAHNFSAVTGACVMTRTDLYAKVGGFSGELAVSFNDVDYCFKVRKSGFDVVYAPQAVLTHMESVSRIPSLDMSELVWFTNRWASELIRDPYYNERFLGIAPPTFEPTVNDRFF